MKKLKMSLIVIFTIYSFCCFSSPQENEKDFSTAVLIHGCHLDTINWEEIMFGNASKQGRVTTGIEEALRENAQVIIWGSGASITEDGLKESAQTFYQATHSKLEHLAKTVQMPSQDLLSFLEKTVVLDLDSHNTFTEIQSALRICQSKKIHKLVLISSPTHIARCLQEGCKQKIDQNTLPLIYARASDICFYHSTPNDVVIIEPPHREDKPQPKIFVLMKRLFPLIQDKKKGDYLYELLDEFLDQYEKTTDQSL